MIGRLVLRSLIFSVLVLIAGASARLAFAQQSEAQPKQSSDLPHPAALAERRIGPGDVLDIRTINESKYSREGVRVDGRGMINIPFVETEIQAACKTEAELAEVISTYYREYLRRPQVDVFIKDYQAQPASVIGAVKQPGRFQLQRQVRLLELLSFAGGPDIANAGRYIHVVHSSSSAVCKPPVLDQQAQADTSFDSYELIETLRGAEKANPFIQPGDIISLPKTEQVFVVGNVFRPSTIPLNEPVTVSQAIAMAGGTIRDTKSDRIRIIRSVPSSPKQEIFVDLRAIEKRKAEDVMLVANDIVDVPVSGGKNFLRSLLGTIAPTVSQLPIRVIP